METAADPFNAARDEVSKSILQLRKLHSEWRQQVQSRGDRAKCKSLHSAVSSLCAEVSRDVAALSRAVSAAERHQTRFFFVGPNELAQRKLFVSQTREFLDSLEADLKNWTEEPKAQRAAQSVELASISLSKGKSSFFLSDVSKHNQQDEQLDELASAASRLQQTALAINEELENQNRMLSDLDDEVERQASEMNGLMRRLAKVMRTSDWKQLCIILWLSAIVAFLFVLLIIT